MPKRKNDMTDEVLETLDQTPDEETVEETPAEEALPQVRDADGIMRATAGLESVFISSHNPQLEIHERGPKGKSEKFVRVTINGFQHEIPCNQHVEIPVEVATILKDNMTDYTGR